MIDTRELEERVRALEAELEAMDADTDAAERGGLRRRIVALYQELDAGAARLAGMRQSVQTLGERFRRRFDAAGGETPAADSSAAARHVRSEGLGAAGGNGDAGSDAARADAAGEMRRAEELDVSTYLDRAWNCLATCRYEDALTEVTRALERVPASVQAETLRGWALMRLDRLEDARQVLEDVLRVSASAALARASLGYVAYRQGRYPEAIEHLSRAARDGIDRKAVLYAHLYLGMLYTRREMFRDGRSFLERAIELGPSLVEAYWEMGRSYYLEGLFTQALDTWRRGAEVNRFDPWGERCQEAVERATRGGTVPLD